jgi:hypothetical protein
MRLKVDALSLSLKGYSPEEAHRLARELPDAIARQVARRDTAPDGLVDRVARQVADRLLQRQRQG